MRTSFPKRSQYAKLWKDYGTTPPAAASNMRSGSRASVDRCSWFLGKVAAESPRTEFAPGWARIRRATRMAARARSCLTNTAASRHCFEPASVSDDDFPPSDMLSRDERTSYRKAVRVFVDTATRRIDNDGACTTHSWIAINSRTDRKREGLLLGSRASV